MARGTKTRGVPPRALEVDSDRVSLARDRIGDLPAEFLSEIAGSKEPWEALIQAWCSSRGLSVLDMRQLSRAVLRVRNFGPRRGRRA